MHYQHGVAGPASSPSAANAELTRLCEAYLSDPENVGAREKFLQRCVTLLKQKVTYYAVYQRRCPRFLAPATFADDAFSLALVKFWAGIRSLRNPARLKPWLASVAYSAVYDELRSFSRRKKDGPCEWQTIEAAHFGEEADIAEEELDRQSGEYSSHNAPVLKQLMHRDILDKVFNSDGDDSANDWLVLKLSLELTVDEIAKQIGKPQPRVRYLLKISRRKFRIVAKRRHNITGSDI
jgi:RNA polymerase sigma factor (sigma-70 family)